MAPNPVAQFHKRHLRIQPPRVPRDAVHRIHRVVANQVNPVRQHHERLEQRPHPVPRKLKIPHPQPRVQQLRAQRAQVVREILQKIVVPRPRVIQYPAFLVRQRHNRPLVKHHLVYREFICSAHCLIHLVASSRVIIFCADEPGARFVSKQGSLVRHKTVDSAPNPANLPTTRFPAFPHRELKLLLYHFFERMISIARPRPSA
jgi:hypothetical protein